MKRLLLVMLLAACGEGTLEIDEPIYELDDEDLVDAEQPLTAYPGITYRSDLETQIAASLQAYRLENGKRPLVGHSKLTDIARERAGFMLSKKKAGCATWFTHKYISGCTETATAHVSTLVAQRIGTTWTWYLWGENIGYNNYSDELSAAVMMTSWKNSPGHDALMKSADFNYVGIGMAKDETSGVKVGVLVFFEAKDVTKPRATSFTVTTSSAGAATLRWGGGTDTFLYGGAAYPLQTHNAGFDDYDVRYRRAGTTTWTVILSHTTATSVTRTFTAGVDYELQLRIRDKNGNVGTRNLAYRR